MKKSIVDVHLKKLERELAERILLLCAFVGSCFGNGIGGFGNRLLESINNTDIDIHYDYDLIDLSKYSIGRNLPFFYEYAYHARCIQGIIWDSWASEIFQEFLDLTGTDAILSSGANFPDWWTEDDIHSGLRDMMKRCHARYRLDFEEEVSIADITLLTNMNEKSVRNALRDEGENKLQSFNSEQIKSTEAIRWMRGRKGGFRETTFIAFDKDELPEILRYIEIAPFIKERLEKLCDHSVGSFRYADAAELLGYSREQIWSILDNVDNLPIKDTHRIAKVINVDPVWFTKQVFTAFFPEQMEMILFKKEIEYKIFTDEQEKPFIEVNLTEKGIKNGYIDLPEKLSKFFPNDCFGDRAADKQGNPIELRFGNEVRNTDMRVKSSITISPRARFGGYFNKVINAKPGDTLRIIKVDDRVFEIKHNPSL